MTTVLCLHAAVAQKSYGTEKRFLCPPPIVHIEGPVWNMKSQQLSMTVVSEGGERSYEQRAPIDHNLSASFKFLHVTGSAKSKSFQLSLDIAEPAPPAPDGSEGSGPGRVWASFDSAPVTIISKPSKKTAKTRNIASCILAGGPVSLFNRINSQTVRTKYMTADNGQLCASNVSWTAFNVNVPHPTGETPAIGPQPVTYGSVIDLVDPLSHTQMLRLTIRKVDKGRIAPDDGGPVSQMQKIALQRTNSDGSRHYLSAASPVPGAQGVGAGQNAASQSGTHPLVWQAPRVREETREGVRVITDEVDDYLCWTIVGISKFQYTFFDAFGHAEPPEMPITPFPTLFNVPILHPTNDSNTLELTVANFFFQHPQTREQLPLNIYLGNIGPLQHNILPPNPPGPLTSISTYVNAIGADGVQRDEPVGAGMSSVDQGYLGVPPIHTSLTVDLPSIATILQALQDDLEPSTRDGPAPQNGSDGKFNVAALNGRSLPLLFIRTVDGVGYHSGRAIAVENVFHALEEMNGGGAGWPQMAEGMQGMLNSQWHLRVI
ncbi:hypothetical protein PHLGIDRAFT_17608 [Phlebiopsis gigantea 11061_1 CR5-6]|uniref:Beta-trefoil n=1 Tax=Phlebiopsis gigantea (strain 11061_1 CR5-6) TaxID=745531 RepID=A0A0C3SFQ5_PHLG1|nr:hypothetical protein PHLGIDRAFT_17608 [Phlebiopsis gigantea 11061_1 CR5-6]